MYVCMYVRMYNYTYIHTYNCSKWLYLSRVYHFVAFINGIIASIRPQKTVWAVGHEILHHQPVSSQGYITHTTNPFVSLYMNIQ